MTDNPPRDDRAQVFQGHSIGMYRLNVLKHRCELEVIAGRASSINVCARVRKEFEIPGRKRQQVVDWLKEFIHNIEVTGARVDVYGHIVKHTSDD